MNMLKYFETLFPTIDHDGILDILSKTAHGPSSDSNYIKIKISNSADNLLEVVNAVQSFMSDSDRFNSEDRDALIGYINSVRDDATLSDVERVLKINNRLQMTPHITQLEHSFPDIKYTLVDRNTDFSIDKALLLTPDDRIEADDIVVNLDPISYDTHDKWYGSLNSNQINTDGINILARIPDESDVTLFINRTLVTFYTSNELATTKDSTLKVINIPTKTIIDFIQTRLESSLPIYKELKLEIDSKTVNHSSEDTTLNIPVTNDQDYTVTVNNVKSTIEVKNLSTNKTVKMNSVRNNTKMYFIGYEKKALTMANSKPSMLYKDLFYYYELGDDSIKVISMPVDLVRSDKGTEHIIEGTQYEDYLWIVNKDVLNMRGAKVFLDGVYIDQLYKFLGSSDGLISPIKSKMIDGVIILEIDKLSKREHPTLTIQGSYSIVTEQEHFTITDGKTLVTDSAYNGTNVELYNDGRLLKKNVDYIQIPGDSRFLFNVDLSQTPDINLIYKHTPIYNRVKGSIQNINNASVIRKNSIHTWVYSDAIDSRLYDNTIEKEVIPHNPLIQKQPGDGFIDLNSVNYENLNDSILSHLKYASSILARRKAENTYLKFVEYLYGDTGPVNLIYHNLPNTVSEISSGYPDIDRITHHNKLKNVAYGFCVNLLERQVLQSDTDLGKNLNEIQTQLYAESTTMVKAMHILLKLDKLEEIKQSFSECHFTKLDDTYILNKYTLFASNVSSITDNPISIEATALLYDLMHDMINISKDVDSQMHMLDYLNTLYSSFSGFSNMAKMLQNMLDYVKQVGLQNDLHTNYAVFRMKGLDDDYKYNLGKSIISTFYNTDTHNTIANIGDTSPTDKAEDLIMIKDVLEYMIKIDDTKHIQGADLFVAIEDVSIYSIMLDQINTNIKTDYIGDLGDGLIGIRKSKDVNSIDVLNTYKINRYNFDILNELFLLGSTSGIVREITETNKTTLLNRPDPYLKDTIDILYEVFR